LVQAVLRVVGEIGVGVCPTVDVGIRKRERGGRHLPAGELRQDRPGELLSVRVAVGVRYSNGEIVCPLRGRRSGDRTGGRQYQPGRHRPCRYSVGVGRRSEYRRKRERVCRADPHRRKRSRLDCHRVRAQCPGRVIRQHDDAGVRQCLRNIRHLPEFIIQVLRVPIHPERGLGEIGGHVGHDDAGIAAGTRCVRLGRRRAHTKFGERHRLTLRRKHVPPADIRRVVEPGIGRVVVESDDIDVVVAKRVVVVVRVVPRDHRVDPDDVRQAALNLKIIADVLPRAFQLRGAFPSPPERVRR